MFSSNDANEEVEELLILQSIYGDEFQRLDVDRCAILVNKAVRLAFWSVRPAGDACPLFSIEVVSPFRWRSRTDRIQAHQTLSAIWREGEPVIHQWVEWLRDNAENHITVDASSEHGSAPDDAGSVAIDIFSSKVVIERKSRLVAHLARVRTLDDVKAVIRRVRTDPKTCDATHNIVAYRLAGPPSLDDRDDDGEGGAGDTILYLLQRMQVLDTIAVVSRWFGGVKLGPDRFRVIAMTVKNFIDELDWK